MGLNDFDDDAGLHTDNADATDKHGFDLNAFLTAKNTEETRREGTAATVRTAHREFSIE